MDQDESDPAAAVGNGSTSQGNSPRPTGFFTPMRVAIWCTVLFVVAIAPVAWMMDRVLQANAADRVRLEMAIRLERYSDAITAAMNRRLTLLSALSTFVQTHEAPGQFDHDLQFFTSGLFSTVDGLVSVRVLQGEHVRVVFPATVDPSLPLPHVEQLQPGSARARAHARALQTRRITMSDPEPGSSGEQLITTYVTVYGPGKLSGETLSITFELSPILREAGLESAPGDLRLVLRTSSGRAFFGQPVIYEQEPVISDLDGPGFSWELAAIPYHGWSNSVTGVYRMLRAAGISITSLLAVLVYLIVGYQERLKSDVRQRTRALGKTNHELQLEAKERQAALEELQETSFALSHAMPGIARLAPEGNLEHVNPDFADLFGKPPEALAGWPWHQDFDLKDDHRLHAAYNRMKQTGNGGFEARVRRADGALFYCEGLLVRRGDSPGDGAGSLLYLRDISERKQQEEKERVLNENLARARRMESIGKLAGGVAHDLNNILGPLVAYPDLILAQLPPDHAVRPDLISIRDASMSAKNVIQDLLTLARRNRSQQQAMEFNQVIDEYLQSANVRELQTRFPQITLQVALTGEPLPVRGSKSQLQQVLLNLLNNAFEAITEPGTVTVTTTQESLDEDRAAAHDTRPGNHVLLSVKDTGEGIESSHLDYIFDPFFSTKEMGRSGTGLGLTSTYGVVRDHLGFIEVESDVGHGSCFRVFLPLSDDDTVAPPPEKPAAIPRGTEKILVVDDREGQRELATRLLSQLGYDVDSAGNGHAALVYLQSQPVDLVVLDMIMEQGFDGLDTFQEIRKLRPDQRCIIASGYAASDRVKSALALGVLAYLPKPYAQQDLGTLVRRVLDQALQSTDRPAPK